MRVTLLRLELIHDGRFRFPGFVIRLFGTIVGWYFIDFFGCLGFGRVKITILVLRFQILPLYLLSV